MKDHKAKGSTSESTADVGGFAACGGLATFEELYGACFPMGALGAPSAEFESDNEPLFVRTPTDQLKGLLASPLSFGKSIVSSTVGSAASDAAVVTTNADEDEEAVMVAREDLTVKRKHRRTEAAGEAAAADAPAEAPKMDAAAKAKLLSMHPGRKTKK